VNDMGLRRTRLDLLAPPDEFPRRYMNSAHRSDNRNSLEWSAKGEYRALVYAAIKLSAQKPPIGPIRA
jgi:hypothetical protein